MNNIETKYYSKHEQTRSIRRYVYTYIGFAITRTILYIVFALTISDDLSLNDAYFYYSDISVLFKLVIFGILYLILFIASISLLAGCTHYISDMDEDSDIKKRWGLYLFPMILDVIAGLIFASVTLLQVTASIVGIIICLAEIGMFMWLLRTSAADNTRKGDH